MMLVLNTVFLSIQQDNGVLWNLLFGLQVSTLLLIHRTTDQSPAPFGIFQVLLSPTAIFDTSVNIA